MEKITMIPRISEDAFSKPNDKGVCTPYKKVEDTSGQKATIWDAKVWDVWEANFGKAVEVDVMKSPQGYWNIRGIKAGATGLSNASAPVPSINDDRNKSIIAQCLVKAVLGQVDSKVEIEEAVEMYKKAYSLI